jgi:hypothetical protein
VAQRKRLREKWLPQWEGLGWRRWVVLVASAAVGILG